MLKSVNGDNIYTIGSIYYTVWGENEIIKCVFVLCDDIKLLGGIIIGERF